MRTFTILIIASMTVYARSQEVSPVEISPEHSIVTTEGGGWLFLSKDGKWLSHMIVAKDKTRPVTLYNLNNGAEVFQADVPMTFGRICANDNYYHDYAPTLLRLWDLRKTDGQPILTIPSGEYLNGYKGGLLTNVEGTHAAAVAKVEDGTYSLRLWDLDSPSLAADSYVELGQIERPIQNYFFAFTVNRGIVAISRGQLARWNIDGPYDQTISLPVGSNRWNMTYGYWRGNPINIFNLAAVHWTQENGGIANTYLSDLPQAGASNNTWRITGSPLFLFDRILLERRADNTFWQTHLTDSGSNSFKLFGPSFGDLFVKPLTKRGEVLIKLDNDRLIDDRSLGFQTYIASYTQPETPPLLLAKGGSVEVHPQSRIGFKYTALEDEDVPAYAVSASQKWLASVANTGNELWDLSTPLAERRAKPMEGGEGAVRQVVVDNRWLILATQKGELSALDLEAIDQPSAIKFFSPVQPKRVDGLETAGKRFYVRNYRTVYVWNVETFSQLLSQ